VAHAVDPGTWPTGRRLPVLPHTSSLLLAVVIFTLLAPRKWFLWQSVSRFDAPQTDFECCLVKHLT
jgi:hypothetical protein